MTNLGRPGEGGPAEPALRVAGPAAVAVSILSGVLVGVVLAIVPWTPVWEANSLIQAPGAWRAFVLSPFTRGAVTGLGLVNLLLAADEARAALRGTPPRG